MLENPIIICGDVPVEHVPVLKARAQLEARRIAKDGTITDFGVVSILKVTTAFVAAICTNLAGGAAITAFKYHCSGTSPTEESSSQIGLLSETTSMNRVEGTQTNPTANQYRSVATITYNNTYAITEHGILNTALIGSGTLMDRSVFSAIHVNNGDSIQFTYTLTINAES